MFHVYWNSNSVSWQPGGGQIHKAISQTFLCANGTKSRVDSKMKSDLRSKTIAAGLYHTDFRKITPCSMLIGLIQNMLVCMYYNMYYAQHCVSGSLLLLWVWEKTSTSTRWPLDCIDYKTIWTSYFPDGTVLFCAYIILFDKKASKFTAVFFIVDFVALHNGSESILAGQTNWFDCLRNLLIYWVFSLAQTCVRCVDNSDSKGNIQQAAVVWR